MRKSCVRGREGQEMIESLESRTFLSATDPYDTYDGTLAGSFTSKTPVAIVGGQTLNLKLRFRNLEAVKKEGTVDLTFVLDKAQSGTLASANSTDPILAQVKLAKLKIGSKGVQVFNIKATVPTGVAEDTYWIAAAVDPGGSIDAGAGYGATVGAATTEYIPAATQVFAQKFTVTPRKSSNGSTVGTVSGTLTNGGNYQATGTVTLNVYATDSQNTTSDDTLMATLTLDLKDLKPRGKKAFKIAFTSTPVTGTLDVGQYYVRVEVDTSKLTLDVNSTSSTNSFSKAPIPLGT